MQTRFVIPTENINGLNSSRGGHYRTAKQGENGMHACIICSVGFQPYAHILCFFFFFLFLTFSYSLLGSSMGLNGCTRAYLYGTWAIPWGSRGPSQALSRRLTRRWIPSAVRNRQWAELSLPTQKHHVTAPRNFSSPGEMAPVKLLHTLSLFLSCARDQITTYFFFSV